MLRWSSIFATRAAAISTDIDRAKVDFAELSEQRCVKIDAVKKKKGDRDIRDGE